MVASADLVPCIGCGASVPARGVPPDHAYVGASPGCWSLFADLRGRELTDARYLAHGRSITDAYMVQHPGVPGRQSSQSVWIHLVGLCLVLEHGLAPVAAAGAMQRLLTGKPTFPWLDPPPWPGATTVADVASAPGPDEYCRAVRRWAQDAWGAWSAHHDEIRGAASRALPAAR